MDPRKRHIIFYIGCFSYVFIGACLFDWSFRMVPFAPDAPKGAVIFAGLMDIFYIIAGIVLFIATFLAIRKKSGGMILYNLIFWTWIAIIVSSNISLIVLIFLNKVSLLYIGDMLTHLILFIPAILLYVNRKKLLL